MNHNTSIQWNPREPVTYLSRYDIEGYMHDTASEKDQVQNRMGRMILFL